jgi:hypothetical protein
MTEPDDQDDGQEHAEASRMGGVDQDPRTHQATEPDEAQILADLYGPPDADGVYRGTGEEDAR